MKKIKSKVFILCVMGCSLITNKAFAQDPGFPGEDPGTPAVPIDHWMFPMLLVVVGLMFTICTKQLNKKVNK